MFKNIPQHPEVAGEELSVVLVGDFNPKIFHPVWFSSQSLLRASEAESATIELVHADFTSFSTDWFVMQVARDRFTVTVKSSAYRSHLRDLVLGTFHNLSHTPISQMGVNYSARLKFRNERDWHSFGHFLVPKGSWTGLLDTPGMRSISVEGKRPDDRYGYIIVSSDPLTHLVNEAVVRVNDHCERFPEDKTLGASYFLEVLEKDYDVIIDRSKALIDSLLQRFSKQLVFDDGMEA